MQPHTKFLQFGCSKVILVVKLYRVYNSTVIYIASLKVEVISFTTLLLVQECLIQL